MVNMQKVNMPTSTILNGVKRLFKTMYGLDVRSLALYRFCFGLLILWDLYERSRDFKAFYTDDGLIDRTEPKTFYFAFHHISGSYYVQFVIFIVHAIVCIAYAIGYKSHITKVLHWLFLSSLVKYHYSINSGGDSLAVVCSFWGMFLPVGKVWSVDHMLKAKSNKRNKDKDKEASIVANAATFLFIFQIQIMYVITTVYKTGDPWKKDYTATFYALNIIYFQTAVARFILKLPLAFTKFLTWAVLEWELWGPLFYIFPIFNNITRVIAVIGFIMLHIGFGSCLSLGIFMWSPIVYNLAFLPSGFWNWLSKYFKTPVRVKSLIIPKKQSEFANYLGKVVQEFIVFSYTRSRPEIETFIDRGQENEYSMNMHDKNFIIYNELPKYYIGVYAYEQGKVLYNIHALIFIFKKISPIMYPVGLVLSFLPPLALKVIDKMLIKMHDLTTYNVTDIKKIRLEKKLKKIPSQWTPIINAIKRVLFIILQFLLLLLMLELFKYNLFKSELASGIISQSSLDLMVGLHLNQPWSMFSPKPPKSSFYPVITGYLMNNSTVDLFGGGAITHGHFKPLPGPLHTNVLPNYQELISSTRWFKLFELGFRKGNPIQTRMSNFICREYNKINLGTPPLLYIKYEFYYMVVEVDNPPKKVGPGTVLKFDCRKMQMI